MIKKAVYVFLSVVVALSAIPVLSCADEQKPDQALASTTTSTTLSATTTSAVTTSTTLSATTTTLMPQADTPETKSSGGWISNGEAYGKWWRQRARALKPVPPELLYHMEASYAYAKSTGNEEETSHKIKTDLTLQKDIYSSVTNYQYKDKESSYGGYPSSKTNQQSLDEYLCMETAYRLDVVGYYQWKTDNKRYIDNRYTAAAGIYYNFFSSPVYKLKVGVLYGYSWQSFMNADLQKFEVWLDDYSSDILMLSAEVGWTITDKLTFTAGGDIKQYLKDTDYKHWVVACDLNYQIWKNVSVFGSYSIDYDSNEVDKIMELEDTDTALNAGIRLSF